MTDAERLRKAGIVVIVPQAVGLVAEWQGPGIALTVARYGEDGRPIDPPRKTTTRPGLEATRRPVS
jgi:hypothetical protein